MPLPSSGRTHLAVRLTVGDPRLITRRWPEHGKPRACLRGNPYVYLEMRAGYQRMITSRTLRGRFPLDLQFAGYFDRICSNPRSEAGNVACDENREMLRGTVDMALGMYFTPSSFTPARYDDALKRLEEAGAGSPPGRLYHVAMKADGQIQVFDVWESEASFQAFGKTLLPIMKDLGADPGQPQASPVHNIIKG